MAEVIGRYKYIYVDGKKVLEHVHVWEQAHGPKPEGCDIHHIDGNGLNNSLENLQCLTKSEHKTLHAQLKREGRDVIDETDPVVIAERARNNKLAKDHRQAHLEEERARDRAEYQKNKERLKQRSAEFYQRHRTEIRAQQAEYEREHRAERSERNKEYYEQHTEERLQYAKEYRTKNREALAAKKRAYVAAHPEQIQAYRAAHKAVHNVEEKLRRAVKRGADATTIANIRQELEQEKYKYKCLKEKRNDE